MRPLQLLPDSLILLLLTLLPTAQGQLRTKLLYTFTYDFFDDTVKNPPSLTDFNNLICLHNEYMTNLFRENSAYDALVFQGTNIDWVFDLDAADPLTVTFAAEVTSPDGITDNIPSANAMSQYSFDGMDFMLDYLQPSDTLWVNVNSMSNRYEIGTPAEGQMERGVCDGTFQEGNEGGATRPPQATSAPTPSPTPDPNRLLMTAIEFQFMEGESREPTPEEFYDLMCITDPFFSEWFQRATGDPTTTATGRVVQYFLNDDQKLWVMIAQVISAETWDIDETVLESAIKDYTRLQVADYIENYAWQTMSGSLFRVTTSTKFSASYSNDPILQGLPGTCQSEEVGVQQTTEAPTAAPTMEEATESPTVARETTQSPTTGEATPSPTVAEEATPSPTTEGATPSPTVARETTQSPTTGGATPSPTVAREATQSPTTEGATPSPTVAREATQSPTTEGATQSPTIAGEATQSPTTEGATQSPTIEEATQSPTTEGATQSPMQETPRGETYDGPVVVFELEFDFEDGKDREPTQDEIHNLLCRTDQYFSDWMVHQTRDPTIQSYGSLLDASYTQGATFPVTISFVSNTTINGGEMVEPEKVLEWMNVTMENIMVYIENYAITENYVSNTAEEDVFFHTIAVNVKDEIRPSLDNLEMPWSRTCRAATRDTQTPSPTTASDENGTSLQLQSATVSPTTASSENDNNANATGPVFVLEFGLDTRDFPLTQTEIEDLMCATDRFFQERMRNVTGDTTIESYGAFIDWEVVPRDLNFPIKVRFLSQSTFGSTGDPVPAETVIEVMKVEEEDILLYIENYVLATAEDNIFQNTINVNFTDYAEGGPQLGSLPRASCPTDETESTETISPTMVTTSSPSALAAGTPTSAPSQSTEETNSPTEQQQTETSSPTGQDQTDDRPTKEPTVQPTISTVTERPMPTVQPTREPDVNVGSRPASEDPTASPTLLEGVTSPSPTIAPSAPTPAPTTGTPAPTFVVPGLGGTQTSEPPSLKRSNGLFPVRPEFLVSNLNGLKLDYDVRFTAGMDTAWSVFATEIVANITRDWRAMGNRRLGLEDHDHRSLSIERVPNSAKVTSITETQCGKTDHLEATCLMIKAEYQYAIVQELQYTLDQFINNETNKALTNGTFQFILERESPGTPLVVGHIQRPASTEFANSGNGDGSGGNKDKMAGWAIFLIILLLLLVCCVPLLLYFAYKRKGDDDNDKTNLPPYEEEDFAYDFLIPVSSKVQTEVDDLEEGNKSTVGVEAAPRDPSTESEEGEEDGWEEGSDGWEDGSDDWEEGDDLNRSPKQWDEPEHAQVERATANKDYDEGEDEYEDDDSEGWENEDEENPNAKEPHTQPFDSANERRIDDAGRQVAADSDEEVTFLQSSYSTDDPYPDDEEREGVPLVDDDELVGRSRVEYEGAHQGGGQESRESDAAWRGYDDHLRGLVEMTASERNMEESINFGDSGTSINFGDSGTFEHAEDVQFEHAEDVRRQSVMDQMALEMMGGCHERA